MTNNNRLKLVSFFSMLITDFCLVITKVTVCFDSVYRSISPCLFSISRTSFTFLFIPTGCRELPKHENTNVWFKFTKTESEENNQENMHSHIFHQQISISSSRQIDKTDNAHSSEECKPNSLKTTAIPGLLLV